METLVKSDELLNLLDEHNVKEEDFDFIARAECPGYYDTTLRAELGAKTVGDLYLILLKTVEYWKKYVVLEVILEKVTSVTDLKRLLTNAPRASFIEAKILGATHSAIERDYSKANTLCEKWEVYCNSVVNSDLRVKIFHDINCILKEMDAKDALELKKFAKRQDVSKDLKALAIEKATL